MTNRIGRGATQVGDVTGTSYSDTGLTDGTAYSYTVRAYDVAGNTSTPSNTATATTPDVTRPSVPGGVSSSWSGRSAQRAVYFQRIAC